MTDAFYDFEVFKHDWLVVIKDTDTKKTHIIVNNVEELNNFMSKIKIIFGVVIIPEAMTNGF